MMETIIPEVELEKNPKSITIAEIVKELINQEDSTKRKQFFANNLDSIIQAGIDSGQLNDLIKVIRSIVRLGKQKIEGDPSLL